MRLQANEAFFFVGHGGIMSETSLSCCFRLLPIFVENGGQMLHFPLRRFLASWRIDPGKDVIEILRFKDSAKLEVL